MTTTPPEASVPVHVTPVVVLELRAPPPLLSPHGLAAGVKFVGVSASVKLVTVLGPLLVTVIVQVSAEPRARLPAGAAFVTFRSACGVSESVSVSLLLPGVGSV